MECKTDGADVRIGAMGKTAEARSGGKSPLVLHAKHAVRQHFYFCFYFSAVIVYLLPPPQQTKV